MKLWIGICPESPFLLPYGCFSFVHFAGLSGVFRIYFPEILSTKSHVFLHLRVVSLARRPQLGIPKCAEDNIGRGIEFCEIMMPIACGVTHSRHTNSYVLRMSTHIVYVYIHIHIYMCFKNIHIICIHLRL